MFEVLTGILMVGFGLLVVSGLVRVIVGRQPGWIDVIGVAVAEAVLLVQGVIAIARMAGGHQVEDGLTFVLYLLASLLILPAAMIWAVAEKSRWSNLVLGIGLLAMIVIVLRMQQVWVGA